MIRAQWLSVLGATAIATGLVVGCRGAVDRHFADTTDSGGTEQEAGTSPEGGGTSDDGGGGGTDAGKEATVDPGSFTVGGTVTGYEGKNLVLHERDGEDLQVTGNGDFTFKTKIHSGDSYDVTVAAQPTDPTQMCTVDKGNGVVGTANVESVAVTCETTKFAIGGNVSGLVGSGLKLKNNGGDETAVASDGAFTFPTHIASGEIYAVTVSNQPSTPTQVCSVSGGNGKVGAADVKSVTVNCSTSSYTVGGTVTGLASPMVLKLNSGAQTLNVSANGQFAFGTPLASQASYLVEVDTPPMSPSQTCVITNPSGTITNQDIQNVFINCTTNSFTVGGNVNGLKGTGLVLLQNGGDAKPIVADGAFQFATPVLSGTNYAVSVQPGKQPTNPWQTCTVSKGSNKMGAAPVTDVAVDCTNNLYTFSATVSGLITGASGLGLTLTAGTPQTVSRSANGLFAFPGSVASGTTYTFAVSAQPTGGEFCRVTAGGSGTVTNANLSNAAVKCRFEELFDSVVAPALPTGFTQVQVGGSAGDNWHTATTATGPSDTAPNHAVATESSVNADETLTSRSFAIQNSNATLSFKHWYVTEQDYDGCVLEVSVAGGAFVDILASGATFTSGGYNATISNSFGSVIGGRQAWSGDSAAYVAAVVQLPASFAGKSVVFRWRLVSDDTLAVTGGSYSVDTIQLDP